MAGSASGWLIARAPRTFGVRLIGDFRSGGRGRSRRRRPGRAAARAAPRASPAGCRGRRAGAGCPASGPRGTRGRSMPSRSSSSAGDARTSCAVARRGGAPRSPSATRSRPVGAEALGAARGAPSGSSTMSSTPSRAPSRSASDRSVTTAVPSASASSVHGPRTAAAEHTAECRGDGCVVGGPGVRGSRSARRDSPGARVRSRQRRAYERREWRVRVDVDQVARDGERADAASSPRS